MSCPNNPELNNPEDISNLENKPTQDNVVDSLRDELNAMLEAMGMENRISQSSATADAIINSAMEARQRP